MGRNAGPSPIGGTPREKRGWPVALVAVAALAAFGSSVGQTFFIGLSGGVLRADLGLTEGGFGALYSVATIASAIAMVWAGGLIDRLSVRTYLLISYGGLALAAVGFALATHPFSLLPVLFGLRLFGQGMLSHGAAVIAGRLPEAIRGRALSCAVAGHPVGEALLPALAVAILAGPGREALWLGVAATLVLMAVVSAPMLGKGGGPIPAQMPSAVSQGGAARPLIQLVQDPRFWLLQPALLAPAFVGTGILFHQTALGEVRGWPLSLFAFALPLYAAGSVAAAFATGWVVDRIGVVRIFGWHLGGLILGAALLAMPIPAAFVPVAYFLVGSAAGATAILATALVAHLYGVIALGRIRAAVAALMVFGTALSPGLYGLLADDGVTWGAILGWSVIGTVLSMLLSRVALMGTIPSAPEGRHRP